MREILALRTNAAGAVPVANYMLVATFLNSRRDLRVWLDANWCAFCLRQRVADLATPLDIGTPPLRANSFRRMQVFHDLVGIWDQNVTLRSGSSWCSEYKSEFDQRINAFLPRSHTLRSVVKPAANAHDSSSGPSRNPSSKARHQSSKYTLETSWPFFRSVNSSIRVIIRPSVRGIVVNPLPTFRFQTSAEDPGQSCSRRFCRFNGCRIDLARRFWNHTNCSF